MINQKICLILLSCLILSVVFMNETIFSKDLGPEVTDSFSIIDENGTPKTVLYSDVKDNSCEVKSNTRSQLSNADKKDITYGVVYLNAKSYDGINYLTYNNLTNPGYTGYTTGAYAKDAAYLGTFNGKVRALQSGTIMEFDTRDVSVVDYTNANISYYYISNGYIYHKFFYGTSGSSNNYRVGYATTNMKEDIKYYSYDGHYFYTSYPNMIKDYQINSHNLSINPSTPHYNYFQFLSHRSKSPSTSSQFDNITNVRVGSSESRMTGMGKEYISHQNTYGVNATLMYGVSANESAYGQSKIAIDKNNLFGHGAVDSNPYWGANGYISPAESIKYHAEIFISQKYLDNEDYRYQGGHLGDKSSGMNVKYASDPYWGEKAASIYYYNDSNMNDYGKYSIGIMNGIQKESKLYQSPSYSSKVVHTLGQKLSPKIYNLPVIILEKSLDSNRNEWYKIQSDTALNPSRTDTNWDAIYDFDRDYVYIPATSIQLISNEKIPTVIRGDVNGNKKVDAADYLMIMDSIVGKFNMSENQKKSGDVNGNGRIDAADYLMIMDCIIGKITL